MICHPVLCHCDRCDVVAPPCRFLLPGGSAEYELGGAIHHKEWEQQSGGLESRRGHYVTYVRSEAGWTLCDDQKVKTINSAHVEEIVRGQTAYIVMYRKVTS